MTAQQILERLGDPDVVGESEFRAIHDTVAEGLVGAQPGTEREIAIAMLTQFRDHANAALGVLS
jgi:hypothetical protein